MRNCELLWEYYKICDALGDFCGFADGMWMTRKKKKKLTHGVELALDVDGVGYGWHWMWMALDVDGIGCGWYWM